MGDATSRLRGDESSQNIDPIPLVSTEEREVIEQAVSVKSVSEEGKSQSSCETTGTGQQNGAPGPAATVEEMEFFCSSPCKFQIIMKSNQNGRKKEKELTVATYPRTGIELMRQIETHFHIPICVQNLQFYNTIIHDDSNLKKLKIQHGDTLHLEYPSEVDIDYFLTLIATLSRISTLLHRVIPELLNGAIITEDLHELLDTDCMAFTGDCIPLKYFSVYPTGTPNANQLYFIHNNGLDYLLDIYKMIHQLAWHSLPLELQELEFSCLQIIWNFSATLGIRQLILQNGVMEEVFQSLLRTKVVSHKPVQILDPLKDSYASLDRSTYMLAETVYAAIVVIGNFAEVPQCRVPIASKPIVIDNMIGSMLSSTYTYTCARSGMCALLCLSFSPETHHYLCNDSVLNRILEICKRIHQISDGTAASERIINQTLVEFYALIFFANIIHHWREGELPLVFSSTVKEFMERYMSNVTYSIIQQRMQEKRYYWSTFVPFLSLCYSPPLRNRGLVATIPLDLRLLCVRAGLLSMKCMCVAENAEEVIGHEGLTDYIMCVPWFMPEGTLMLSAQELVSLAQQTLRPQPPSLTNVVKAFLASDCCGLERTLKRDVHSVLLDPDVCRSYFS